MFEGMKAFATMGRLASGADSAPFLQLFGIREALNKALPLSSTIKVADLETHKDLPHRLNNVRF